MKTCKKCGTQLPEEAKFCSTCGASTVTTQEEFFVDSDHLVSEVKRILHEGNVTRIVVKDESDRVLLDIPVTIGIIGALIAPWLAALGAIAALVTRCKIVVERRQ